MPLDLSWFHSLDPAVGGDVDTSNSLGAELETGLWSAAAGDLSDTVTSEPSDGSYVSFYRKIWLRNEGAEIEAPKLFISLASYPGQVAVARSQDDLDTSADNWTAPPGYIDDDFESPNSIYSGMSLLDGGANLGAGAYAGLWIRIRIPPGASSDPAAVCQFNVFGRLA